MSTSIKTWRERYQEDADCKPYGVAGEIQDYMQAEIDELRALLTELNLQYISDFGQLQESSFDFANTTMALVEDYAKAVHDGDDAACAVLQKTIRASLEQYTTVPLTGEVRLWDSQWINVVNHDNCYAFWSTEDAVQHAVKMTEQLIAKNVAENNLPPKPKGVNQ